MKNIYKLSALILLSVLFTNLQGQWAQQGPKLYGTNALGPQGQGQVVTISADGKTAVLSTGNDAQAGGFFVFRLVSGQWTQQAFISGYPGTDLGGGLAISADGNTIATTTWGVNTVDSIDIYFFNGISWNLQFTMPASYKAEMSRDGNTLLVGADVWVRNGNSYALQATLHPTDATFGNSFWPTSTGQISADGNTAIIGQYEASDSADMVWVFIRTGTNWAQQGAKLQGVDDTALVPYGVVPYVALSGDGNTLAFQDLWPGQDATIWVFQRVGGTWVEDSTVQVSMPETNGGLSLNYNGNRLVAGTFQCSFDYFTRSGSVWTDQGYSSPANFQMVNGNVGCSITIDSLGNNVLISNYGLNGGQGGGYAFARNGNTFYDYGFLFGQGCLGNDLQGSAVAMSGDGQILAVSSIYDGGNEGAVWTYQRNGNAWTQMGPKLQIADLAWAMRDFGSSLSLSADGSVLAIGSQYSWAPPGQQNDYGNVFIYNLSVNQYVLTDSLYNMNASLIGRAVAISADGKTVISGTYNNGAYVFVNSGGVWTQQAVLDSGTAWLGPLVALSADGNTAVVADQFDSKGSFYVFVRNGSTWSMQLANQHINGLLQGDFFPSSLAVSADGNVIAAGCGYVQNQVGNVYIFNRNGTTWTRTDSLVKNSSANIGHGNYVIMSSTGDTIVESVLDENSNNNIFGYIKSGNAYGAAVPIANPVDVTYPLVSALAGSADLQTFVSGFQNDSSDAGGNGGNGSAVVYVAVTGSFYDTVTELINDTCPQSSNGKIKIQVGGGTAPYTTLWSNGSTADSVINLSAGTYTVTVSDAGGNSVISQYTIGVLSNLSAGIPIVSLPCTSTGGYVALNVSGSYQPFIYAWNTVPAQQADTAVNLAAGTYIATITDALGCSITDTVTLQGTSYWVDVTSTQPNCGNNGIALASPYGGTAPYHYLWSNGDTLAMAGLLPAGAYYVTVTDSNNCSASASALLNTYCNNIIQGRVFFDRNNNCVQDSGEAGAFSYILSASNGAYTSFGSVNDSGDYQILVPGSGNFSVQIAFWQDCEFKVCNGSNYPMQVSFAGTGDTASGVNFALLNSEVDLALFAKSQSANPGFGDTVIIYYGNIQDSILPGTITIQFDSTLILNSTNPPYTSYDAVSHTATWVLPAIGPLYASSNIFGNQQIALNFTIPSSAIPKTSLPVMAAITPTQDDCNTANNFLTLPIVILGSLDPNGKVAWPGDIIYTDDSVITYTIHFQNTGTDSTHFIVVTDTLGAHVQPGSVRTVAASFYPYTFTVSQNGILTWRFDPLALPDSGTSQQASQGFVTYQVTTQPSLPVGTIINNSAAIYFDYNSAVYTNIAQNVVTANPLGIENMKAENYTLSIYPNPASNLLYIKTEGLHPENILIYDVDGQTVAKQSFTPQIDIHNLTPGVYLLEVNSKEGVARKRWVKM